MLSTNRPENLKLGCKAKDTITGFTGVAIAITDWLNGCRRVTLQSQELKDGRPIDSCTFDVEQLEVVEPAPPQTAQPTGGPSISPVQRTDPSR